MNDATREHLAALLKGYPVDVSQIPDGILAGPGCEALPSLRPGPGLGLVQVGIWAEEEHHPGPVYLDLDPRRLRAGHLDVLIGRLHYGPVERISETLAAWSTTASSVAQATALTALWESGQRCAAVAELSASLVNLDGMGRREAYRSQEALAFLEAAIDVDPLSLSLRYTLQARQDLHPEMSEKAAMVLAYLDCHTWSRGNVTLDAIAASLDLAASFHPSVFGNRLDLALDYSLDGRRKAVDTTSDPERALHLAVDWAHDTDRTDAELEDLLRPLAARSAEPVWSRLCEFRS